MVPRDDAPVRRARRRAKAAKWSAGRACGRFRQQGGVPLHGGELRLRARRTATAKAIGARPDARLIELARANGFHTIIAGIAGENPASVRLHERFGFEVVGTEREVGYKFERWLDVTWMQMMLA